MGDFRGKFGLRLRNAHHLLLMMLPNLFNLFKLVANIRHPIYEVIHSSHNQYQINGSSLYVVEHFLFGRLVTVDVVEIDSFPLGLIKRALQLFKRDFYYGHCEYFPQPFRLLDRKYVRREDFSIDKYLERFI